MEIGRERGAPVSISKEIILSIIPDFRMNLGVDVAKFYSEMGD